MKFEVNGEPIEVDASARPGAAHPAARPRALRGEEGLRRRATAARAPCCVDGGAVHSCIYPAHRLDGRAVTTVAGLGTPEAPASGAAGSFVDAGGFQCGFCTAGHGRDRVDDRAATEHDDLAAAAQGQPVPLHRLPRDPRRDLRRRATPSRAGRAMPRAARSRPRRACASSPGASRTRSTSRTTALLHLAVLGSPHAHARILSIDTSAAARAARRARGAHPPRLPRDAVLDRAPRAPHRRPRRHARARHGAALPRAAGRGRRRRHRRRSRSSPLDAIVVEYEVLPAVFDPEVARSPGAPLLHGDKGADVAHRRRPSATRVAEFHGEIGDVDAALRRMPTAVVTGTWQTQRVQHAALETHATRGWLDDDGRLVLRTSSQVPFLVRDELCHIFGLDRRAGARVHRARRRRLRRQAGDAHRGPRDARRAAHRARRCSTSSPARTSSPIAPTRHPMRVGVTLGATADGMLTAMEVDELMDTGAYGNHGIGVMFHAVHESIERLPLREQASRRPVGLHEQPAVGRLPRLRPRPGDLRDRVGDGRARARSSASTRSSCGAATSSCPATRSSSPTPTSESTCRWRATASTSASTSSSRRCDAATARRPRPGWRVGTGMALAMIATIAAARPLRRGVRHRRSTTAYFEIGVGTAEFGNGTTTVHAQLVATALGTTVDAGAHPAVRHRRRRATTPARSGRPGVVVAGKALLRARPLRLCATQIAGRRGLVPGPHRDTATHDGTPRSVAFNVHGVPGGGERRDRRGAHPAVDPGRRRRHRAQPRAAARPDRGRHRAGDRHRAVRGDAARRRGSVTTTALRNYHIPQFADVPAHRGATSPTPTTRSARSARSR